MPKLEEKTRIEIEALTREKVFDNRNYQFHHFLFLGLNEFAHPFIMKKAKELVKDRDSLEKFIKEYNLRFPQKPGEGFLASFKPIKESGIYIPSSAFWQEYNRTEGNARLFYKHYAGNWLGYSSYTPEYKKEAKPLFKRIWIPEDFLNPELIQKAFAVGKDLWDSRRENFEKYKNPEQEEEITRLGRELMRYYNEVLN